MIMLHTLSLQGHNNVANLLLLASLLQHIEYQARVLYNLRRLKQPYKVAEEQQKCHQISCGGCNLALALQALLLQLEAVLNLA